MPYRPCCIRKIKVGSEFSIRGFGWNHTDTGFSKYYILDIKDGHIEISNEVQEDCLCGIGEINPHEEYCFLKSADDVQIEIGQKVYWHVIQNDYYQKPPTPNINFCFAGYGNVVSMHYHKEKYSSPIKKVRLKREFLCEDENGRKWGDARQEGFITEDNAVNVYLKLPENYPELYVDELIKREVPGYPCELSPNCKNWYFEVKTWLTHIGVYDKVIALYNEKKERLGQPNLEQQKEAREKTNEEEMIKRLKEFVSTLSPEEIVQLKKLI